MESLATTTQSTWDQMHSCLQQLSLMVESFKYKHAHGRYEYKNIKAEAIQAIQLIYNIFDYWIKHTTIILT